MGTQDLGDRVTSGVGRGTLTTSARPESVVAAQAEDLLGSPASGVQGSVVQERSGPQGAGRPRGLRRYGRGRSGSPVPGVQASGSGVQRHRGVATVVEDGSQEAGCLGELHLFQMSPHRPKLSLQQGALVVEQGPTIALYGDVRQ